MPPDVEIEDYGRVLKLPNIKIIHDGDYRCTVTRENGQSSYGNIRVPVDGRIRQLDIGNDKICYIL